MHDVFSVRVSCIHGQGCFATEDIEPSSLIGRFEVEPVEQDGPHVLWLDDDGLLITNELRFLNHAPDPNAFVEELEVRAVRPIAAGEEITIHYGEDWPSE